MEQPINEELYTETVEPAKRFIRSDVALYVLVVVVVFAAILLVSALIVLLGLPEFVSQLVLFAALLVFGWRLYRVRLLSYRYTLTERMLSVDRIVGRKQRPELAVHLSDITHIRPAAQLPQKSCRASASACAWGDKTQATAVAYRAGGEASILLLSLSDGMREKLIAQWKTRTPVTPAPQHTLPAHPWATLRRAMSRASTCPVHKGRGMGRFLPPERRAAT